MKELTPPESRIARDIGVPAMHIHYVVYSKCPENVELALRLGIYFGQALRYWLNLQSRYDLDTAEDTLADKVGKISTAIFGCRIASCFPQTVNIGKNAGFQKVINEICCLTFQVIGNIKNPNINRATSKS